MVELTMLEALAWNDSPVYMLVPITDATTVQQLRRAGGFVAIDENDHKPEEPPVKKKGGRPKKVDIGKLRALAVAGWTATEIGGELNLPLEQVEEILEKEGL